MTFSSALRSATTLVLFSIGASCLAADATPTEAAHASINAYMQAWTEHSAPERTKLLERCWAKEGRYTDPTGSLAGADALSTHIAQFLEQFPHAVLTTTSNVDMYGKNFRYTWHLDFGGQIPAIDGLDVGEIDDVGRLTSVVGFFGRLQDLQNKQNQALVSTYLNGLFKKFDMAALDQVIAKDAVYNQAAGLPYGGRFVGLPEWIKMFTHAGELFTIQVAEPVLLSNESGDQIVASFSADFVSKKSAKHLTMTVQEHFDLKDGKIVAITPHYFDTKTFVDFLNEGPAAK